MEKIYMGNSSDFEKVFKNYYAPLCFYAENLNLEHEDAEDLVEELFTKLFHRNEAFINVLHAKMYLYRATRNACLNFLRDHHRSRLQQGVMSFQDTEGDFLNSIIHNELIAEIYRAIQQLPPQCSKVISLAYLEDMKNEEIAKELQLSLQTVKNHKSRGLMLLKEKLSGKTYLFFIGLMAISAPF